MNELQPLDIIDDRTIEQIRADGCERWPDGRPYINNGVRSVCGANVEQELNHYPVHVCLVKLETPEPCKVHLLAQEEQQCAGLAHWTLGNTAMCDKCVLALLEQTPDNREWLAPALADIRQRYLRVGARVRIQAMYERGQLGTICARSRWSDDAWYVRSDRRPATSAGILCLTDELDVIL